jgi:hypothetical protein
MLDVFKNIGNGTFSDSPHCESLPTAGLPICEDCSCTNPNEVKIPIRKFMEPLKPILEQTGSLHLQFIMKRMQVTDKSYN